MSECAVTVESVSKFYRIWHSPRGRLLSACMQAGAHLMPALRGPVGRWEQRHFHDFQALRDINLQVRKGEAVGIVGRNGSGKSTLLQIIAGTLTPTAGSVNVAGKVAALLELGSGFNPEYTGRENVFLNASLLGLSEEATMARFEDIVAFADIGDFIGQPVKTYSSGMVVRLAFAVAAHVDADILIVDEALSVGDARFQMKCARAIDRFLDAGTTLLFVSHDASSINRLCNAAVLLDGGRIRLFQSPKVVTNIYLKMMVGKEGPGAVEEDIKRFEARPFEREREKTVTRESYPSAREVDARDREDQILRKSEDEVVPLLSAQEYGVGGQTARIQRIELFDEEGSIVSSVHTGDALIVVAEVEARTAIPAPIFAIRIRDAKGVDIYGTNSHYLKMENPPLREGDVAAVRFELTANMMQGNYFISVGCSHFSGDDLIVHHRRYDALPFSVLQRDHSFGSTNCMARIAVGVRKPPEVSLDAH